MSELRRENDTPTPTDASLPQQRDQPAVIDGEPTFVLPAARDTMHRANDQPGVLVDGEPQFTPPARDHTADHMTASLSPVVDGEPRFTLPGDTAATTPGDRPSLVDETRTDSADTTAVQADEAGARAETVTDTPDIENPGNGGDSDTVPDDPAEQDNDEPSETDNGHQRQPADDHKASELTDAEKAEFFAYEQRLIDEGRTRPANGTGPAYDYQRRHCGDVEYRLSPDEALPKAAWADGLNRDEALAQDSKYVGSERTSFYRPDGLPPFLADQAINDADIRLTKYKDAIEDPSNPLRGLEIITNHPESAEFFAARMEALGVPGKVSQRD